jgi:N-acetylneuraminate synthase/N,N'-diacetyllegionaminate synthase
MEIIAEIGQNHNGDMELAKNLIKAAADNGAHVAKFQLYDAKALFPKAGNQWYDYNCKTELSRAQVEEMVKTCGQYRIEFMASVFDTERIQWLEALGVKRYKIASRSIHDKALIQRICETKKPLLISLGMWDKPDFPVIDTSADVGFLYCITNYPTSLESLRFEDVDFAQYRGFSDHTVGIVAAQAALARGASVIEKHFTLDKALWGPDHAGSMTPDELNALSRWAEQCVKTLR